MMVIYIYILDVFSGTNFNKSDKKTQGFIRRGSKSVKDDKVAYQFRFSLNRAKSRII